MPWQPTVLSLLAVGAAGVSAAVAVSARRHGDQRGARAFTWLTVALAGWALAYAIQLGFATRAEQLLWQRVASAIAGAVPTLWLLFTLRYAGRDQWLTRGRRALLAIEPLLFAALVLTNPYHGLIWQGGALRSAGDLSVVAITFGPGYYAHIAYAYLLVLVGFGLLGLVFARASLLYRRQSGLLVLAALLPFAANVAYTLGVPDGPLSALDPTPFAFPLTGVLIALALFRFDLLQRTPVARQQVLADMGDGLIVLDDDGRVVEANAVARRAIDPPPAVGRSIVEVAPGEAAIAEVVAADTGAETGTGSGTGAETETGTGAELEAGTETGMEAGAAVAALEALDGRTITATVGDRQCAYDVAWSPLTDQRGETAGHVIALRDVTDRNRYEQRLEVAQRVLRHNLRNDMTVIQGWADQLAEAGDDGRAAAARHITDTANDLIDLSEKVETIVRIEESAPAERVVVDASARIAALADAFRAEYPTATVECEVPATATVRLPDAEFLETPIRNLIENAIEHNDAREPWVRVSAEATADGVRVRVEDDGPEIPAMEREVLEEGTEDPLHHGSGVGLWLTYWTLEAVGGSVTFDTREPRGNVVTLEFPTAGTSRS